jgi:hypothetical protein
MAIVDITHLVDQRLKDIKKQNPSMGAEDFYFEEEDAIWALVTILGSGDRPIEYDFIESEESWRRESALTEYFQAALDQVKVMVVVPDMSLADMLTLVKFSGLNGILVTDYSAMGLIPLPLTY